MRVTQSMLSNNMLRNLSNSYNKMGKLQEQLESGKKVNRPSDDPVSVMKGMGYRMQVDKVRQFQRNIGEAHNWLDNTDDALNHVGSALHRANELIVSGSTDTMTPDDRVKLQSELKQLQSQIRDLANTKVGNKYIFSGTKTSEPLFKDGNIQTGDGFGKSVDIEVFDGVTIDVNTTGEFFEEIDELFTEMIGYTNGEDFSESLEKLNAQLDIVLGIRADIGARQNRVDMMTERLESLEVTSIKQMSDNEDVNFAKAITELITEESIHRAALSVGARIIQPSLVDFLR